MSHRSQKLVALLGEALSEAKAQGSDLTEYIIKMALINEAKGELEPEERAEDKLRLPSP